MPLVFGDRVKETSTSVGLSSFTLDGAAAGFQSFVDGIGNGNQCFYTIENETDNAWEVGIGTVAGASLSRDSVLSSSNSGLPVNFASGTKQVFATEAAQHFNNALDSTAHAAIDHTGIPGVGGTETFTASAHAATDHFGLPGVPAPEAYTSAAHNADDHSGVTAIAPPSQVEAEGGTSTTPRLWTAERVKNSIDALGGGGGGWDPVSHNADDHSGVTAIQPPSQAVAEAGVETTSRLWTAERVAQAIAAQSGLLTASQHFPAVAGTITVSTGFQPKIVFFVGSYIGGVATATIGYATGTGSSQACAVAGALESALGAICADSGGGTTILERHNVVQFDATQVSADQVVGSSVWSGFVVVLGG